MDEIEYFLGLRISQAFALVLQGFGDMDGNVLHPFMGFRGTANEEEFLAFGDPLVSVLVIETDADEATVSVVFVFVLRATGFSVVFSGDEHPL